MVEARPSIHQKRDLYSEVTARILAELEQGAAPWVKPWSATPAQNVPCNAVTNRPYSGCNVILLWLTRVNAAVLLERFGFVGRHFCHAFAVEEAANEAVRLDP